MPNRPPKPGRNLFFGSFRSPARLVALVAGIAVSLAIALVPSELHRMEGFGRRPAYAAAVSALMAIFWLGEVLPIVWTACLPLLLFPALGVFGHGFVGDLGPSAERYVDAYIFLFVGGMAIGAAMEQWNLHRRVALHIMRAIGRPGRDSVSRPNTTRRSCQCPPP